MIYKKLGSGISFIKGRPVLNIFARDENNKKVTVPVRNLPIYFYVKADTEFDEDDMKKIIKITNGYVSIYGDELKKVFVYKISEMRKLSKAYHGFEGDMNWDKKMLLDLKITNLFYEEDGKVYSLDKRFIRNNTKVTQLDGAKSEVSISGPIDEDKLDKLRLQAEETNFKFRILCIDLEMLVEKKDDLRTYDGEIVCGVCYDSYTGKYFKFRQDENCNEKQLLKDIFKHIKEYQYDIITGWNVEFDIRWLLRKADAYDIELEYYFKDGKTFINAYRNKKGKYVEDIKMPGKAIMDGKELYIKQTKTSEKQSSYSLKSVAIYEGFDEWDDLGSEIKYWWKKNPDKVVEYCKLDVEKTMDIVNKKQLLENANILCGISGANLDESMWNSKVIDSMLFLYKDNNVLPNIRHRSEEKDIEGARVLKTTSGIHHGVGIFDAASLYPSIITGLNISGETLIEIQKPESYKKLTMGKVLNEGDYYDINVKVNDEDRRFTYLKPDTRVGLLPKIVNELRKRREQIRDDRMKATERNDKEAFKQLNDEEKVTKGLLASVYGVTGYDSFRLFNEDCANTITAVARGVVLETLDKLQSDEYQIIYGDTDSVFIK